MIPGQECIQDDDVIAVTGGTGLFGNGMQDVVKASGVRGKWLFMGRKDCELTDLEATRAFFARVKPTYVVHLAAYVGGLFRNSDPLERVNFWVKNVNMNNNVLMCCHEFKVKKCISSLSTCIFPQSERMPMTEDRLFEGPPHFSNAPYAYSKRMLAAFCQWLNAIETVTTKFISVIPCNLFGPHDNFNLKKGHVIPGLIHKCKVAKETGTDFVVWGSGKPLRQFLLASDAARMLLTVFYNYDGPEEWLSVSVAEEDEVSIRQAAEAIVKAFDFRGKLVMDDSKADGQFRKTTSNALFMKTFPDFKLTPFQEGVQQTVDWFVKNYDTPLVRK